MVDISIVQNYNVFSRYGSQLKKEGSEIMAMRRVTLVIPLELDEKILQLKKEDRFLRSSYAAVIRQLLETGLQATHSQMPPAGQSGAKDTSNAVN